MKGNVAFFLPNIHTTGRHEYAHYLRCKLVENGCHVMIFSSFTDLYHGDALDIGEKSIYTLYDKIDMKAAVIYSELIKDKEICEEIAAYCKSRRIPVFAVERGIKGAFNISYDYESSFRDIVDHIIERHGAKDICLISGMENNSFSEARNLAYRESLEAHGLKFDERNIYYGQFWEDPAKELTRKIIAERSQLPDAIVCANDAMAIAVCTVLEENGIGVPDDVIVTGFDGIENAEMFCPSITTAKPDYRSAADFIFSRIVSAGKGVRIQPEDRVFGCTVIEGQSCGCKPIPKRAAGRVFSGLEERLRQRQVYRLSNDLMMLRNMDGRGITSVLEDVKKYFAEVIYTPCELYLDPTFFGYTDTAGAGNVLAIRSDMNSIDAEVPFEAIEEGRVCSEWLMERSESLIFAPVHCLDRVYGYAVFSYEPRDVIGGWRLYDFVTHLNILLASVETTTQLNETIEQLGVLYIHDQLTELLNRRGFYRELRRLIKRAEKEGFDLLFVSGDLNGLKFINDNFGHSEGDFAISSTAKVLFEAVGDNGIVARFGGDEYMVAMPAYETADSFEARVYTAIDKLNLKSGKPYDICISLGTEKATAAQARDSVQDIMKRADDKMFAKKVKSRHRR